MRNRKYRKRHSQYREKNYQGQEKVIQEEASHKRYASITFADKSSQTNDNVNAVLRPTSQK